MVALGEKLCRNDTKAQRGRRRRRVGFGRNGNSPAASGYSVISVAGNYPNGGLTGNIPNGTTDCIWQHWQTMEERNPFGSSGSTQRPKGISMLSDSTIRTQRVYWGFAFLVVGWAPSSARLGGICSASVGNLGPVVHRVVRRGLPREGGRIGNRGSSNGQTGLSGGGRRGPDKGHLNFDDAVQGGRRVAVVCPTTAALSGRGDVSGGTRLLLQGRCT